jgi:hypothetical protein
MVHGTHNIKINTLSSSQDNSNVHTSNFDDGKTEAINKRRVVLNVMN